jgi:hypothetical protein
MQLNNTHLCRDRAVTCVLYKLQSKIQMFDFHMNDIKSSKTSRRKEGTIACSSTRLTDSGAVLILVQLHIYLHEEITGLGDMVTK